MLLFDVLHAFDVPMIFIMHGKLSIPKFSSYTMSIFDDCTEIGITKSEWVSTLIVVDVHSAGPNNKVDVERFFSVPCASVWKRSYTNTLVAF